MIDEQDTENPLEDIIDIALREAVRQGRVVRSKDDEGRDVYTAVPVN